MVYDFSSRYTLLRTCTFAFGNTQFLLEIFLFQLHFLSLLFLPGPLQRCLKLIGRLLPCDFGRPIEPLRHSFALPVRFCCFLPGGFVGEVAHFLEFGDFAADFAFGDVVLQSAEDVFPFVTVADLGSDSDRAWAEVAAAESFGDANPYISHRLGGTGDPPVPPGHWPGGIRRTINVEKTRLMAGCCFTFRSASRRPGQAGRLSHPRIRQQV
jgi:hypothetical protein